MRNFINTLPERGNEEDGREDGTLLSSPSSSWKRFETVSSPELRHLDTAARTSLTKEGFSTEGELDDHVLQCSLHDELDVEVVPLE